MVVLFLQLRQRNKIRILGGEKMKVNSSITEDVFINNGFIRGLWAGNDIPTCNWYMWLNNSRLLTIHKDKANQYKVKQVGRRDCFNVECTKTNFIKTKIVKDLIDKGILIEE